MDNKSSDKILRAKIKRLEKRLELALNVKNRYFNRLERCREQRNDMIRLYFKSKKNQGIFISYYDEILDMIYDND